MRIERTWFGTLTIVGLTLVLIVESRGQTVKYEDGFATGIDNLRLSGTCYDVRFVDGSYLSTYSDATPAFLYQPVAANHAANVIRDILNSQRFVPEINLSESEVLWIPNERVSRTRFRAEQVGHDTSSAAWQRYGDFQGEVDIDYARWDYAVFESGPKVIYADNTGYAAGIQNLNIDGECLDVRFARGSYNEVFDSSAPRYLGYEANGHHAANEIMAILNGETSTPEINSSNNEILWIPTDRTRGEFEAEQLGHNQSALPWQRFGDFSGTRHLDFQAWDFVVFDASLDCNSDGIVDVNDMNCACGSGLDNDILDAIGSLPGDINGNGIVGFADFLNFSQNFGQAGKYTDGDFNCDGMVDFGDFLIMSENYGQSGVNNGPSFIGKSVPEPSSHWLVALGVPMLMSLRRR